MPTSAQVSVAETATVIVAATAFDQTVCLHNLGGGASYLGDAGVTIANGYTALLPAVRKPLRY